ncbi:MAG: transposase [Rhodobacteraceae bacterium]|nr:transposase [Paracoccaceae bacterium]
MTDGREKEWWTAAELAGADLPDIPDSRQGIEAMAKRLGWRGNPGFARRRSGRGGGWEYHWRLLPSRAQRALIGRADGQEVAQPDQDRDGVWSWFDGLPEKSKDKAKRNLRILQDVEALLPITTKYLAVGMIAKQKGCSARTIWSLYQRIEGVDPADWLPYLAPRHRGAQSRGIKSDAAPEFFDWLKADYLRIGPHTFRSSYDRAVELCQAHGLGYLQLRTAYRWLDQNVPRVVQIHAREGDAGLAKCFPPQIRDRSTLTALEGVNADCHKIDVFVKWPDIDKPVRPQIVAFQDLYSNKILSWRVDLTPNKVAVMSAFGELIETWGIPHHCLFDNGREFANKWLSGGTPTRFRFKVREDDPLGVLPQMNIKIHWATPGHGQAKPIERGFRDFADRIALDPRFAGAYVGKAPDAKPEDYGSRAIPLDTFLRVLDEGVRKHNAREGRTSDTAAGRSFDQTFAESYAVSKIRKATAEQHRLWLMGQEVRKLHKHHGGVTLHKNRYWGEWMNEHAGEHVVARFDPENLHAGTYIYTLAGEYLGMAECREKVGFFDLVGAKLHARAERQRRKAQKALLDAMRPVSVHELAAEIDRVNATPTSDPLVEAKVVEMLPARVRKPLVQKPLPTPDPESDDRAKVFQATFGARDVREEAPSTKSSADLFWQALDIERRTDAGDEVTDVEAAFLARMQKLPEYRAQRRAYDQFGATAIG